MVVVAESRAALPSLAEVLDSKTDLWGEASLRQPNGPSYEFFAGLLPPLRYVNADFRFYPLVLSAPYSGVKARLISNGSGVNLRGGARGWKDVGTPVTFRVGPDELRFGELTERLEHPRLAKGYLPIPSIRYAHGSAVYELEAFAGNDPVAAEYGVVFISFRLVSGTNAGVTVEVDAPEPRFRQGQVLDAAGKTLIWLDSNWKWERQRAHASITMEKQATLAIATIPLEEAAAGKLKEKRYGEERERCVQTWERLLQGAMQVTVPEPIVNDAWRQLLVQNFSLIHSNRIHYSAGNQYDALYESEGSDAMMALLLWGYEAEAGQLLVPLLDFSRPAIRFNQAGHKLENVARYYWQTRDAAFLRSLEPRWAREVKGILENRGAHGLLPREAYCNDIPTPVFSLNSNGKCWRGLRDLGTALADAGEAAEGKRLLQAAAEFRKDILAAVERSTFTNTEPPFIPIALMGEEKPYDPLCATKMGSYWNLMVNFVLGFEVLGPGSEREDWLLRYIQQHGGLCMGLERSRPASAFWTSTHNLNPLYGMRYALTLLRRDEPERALVTFYGMLAQGFTRHTFITGEGNALMPLDASGRQVSYPPNSAGNAHLLQVLRWLLVQDCDLDDDGIPETLRLAFATPRRWLEQGKHISVERAPTAFGPVSFSLRSRIDEGIIEADVSLPVGRAARQTLLRVRPPEGWKIISASAGGKSFSLAEAGTVDVSAMKGSQSVLFRVVKQNQPAPPAADNR